MFYSLVILSPSSSRIVHWLAALFRDDLGLPGYMPAKIFHFGMHLFWTVLFLGALAKGYRRGLSPGKWPLFLVTAALFVIVPEMLQFLNPERTPSLTDIILNSGGIFSGIFLHAQLGTTSMWSLSNEPARDAES